MESVTWIGGNRKAKSALCSASVSGKNAKKERVRGRDRERKQLRWWRKPCFESQQT